MRVKLMDVDSRIWALVISLLCLAQDYGSCSQIIQGPQNVTVLSGSNASFQCTVAADWQSISWSLQNVFVVTISHTGMTVSTANIVVENSTNNNNFTSMITIINVNRSNAGLVQCGSLSAVTQSAYLSVQVKGSVEITNGSLTVAPNSTLSMVCRAAGWYPAPAIAWELNNTAADTSHYSTNYNTSADGLVTALSTFITSPEGNTSLTCMASVSTLAQPQSATVNIVVREQTQGSSSSLSQTDIILIAVFCSIGGLLLLILIILLIVFCCRKKEKETGYQSDTWKAPERNVSNLRTVDQDSFGDLNFGYNPEPVEQSFHSNNSNNSAPSVVTATARTSAPQVQKRNWTGEDLRPIRHITHV